MALNIHWRYKNTSLLVLGLIISIFLYNFEPFRKFLLDLDSLGYFGSFIAGVLYASTFTVATSAVILLVLAQNLNPFLVGIFAALGTMLGNYLIFKFVKDNLLEELKTISRVILGMRERKRIHFVKHLFQTSYFHWLLPVIVVIILGSPFPDELAVGLLGVTKIKTYQFLLVSFIFSFLGIFLIISLTPFIKPFI